jgi:dUTP pyrophosphatase
MNQILIKLLSDKGKIPTRANINDAGLDLYSAEDAVIHPSTRALIKTDIAVQIPTGYYGRIAPRSGLALKNGIDVFGGVVDSQFRGCVGVILFNSEFEQEFKVNVGDRIAQLIIEAHYNFDVVTVFELDDSSRGTGGFGSSGHN